MSRTDELKKDKCEPLAETVGTIIMCKTHGHDIYYCTGKREGRTERNEEVKKKIKSKCSDSEDGKHYWQSDDEDNPKEIICIHCMEKLLMRLDEI